MKQTGQFVNNKKQFFDEPRRWRPRASAPPAGDGMPDAIGWRHGDPLRIGTTFVRRPATARACIAASTFALPAMHVTGISQRAEHRFLPRAHAGEHRAPRCVRDPGAKPDATESDAKGQSSG
jgi:hypothetical protein